MSCAVSAETENRITVAGASAWRRHSRRDFDVLGGSARSSLGPKLLDLGDAETAAAPGSRQSGRPQQHQAQVAGSGTTVPGTAA